MLQCEICKEHFARSFTLKRHIQSKHAVASIRYQHKCNGCSEVFARRDHLQRHQEYTHGDGRQPCQYCSRDFRQDYLKEHEVRCARRRRLSGKTVVRDHGYSRRAKTIPRAHETETLQQLLDASFYPDEMLQRSEEDVQMTDAAPHTNVICSTTPLIVEVLGGVNQEVLSSPELDPSVESWDHQDVHPRLLLRPSGDSGRGPPNPHHFLLKAVEEMREFSPELNIIAASRLLLQSRGSQAQGILCLDCDHLHVSSNLERAYLDFHDHHMRTPLHKAKLKERLLSDLAKSAGPPGAKQALKALDTHSETLLRSIEEPFGGWNSARGWESGDYHLLLNFAVEHNYFPLLGYLLEILRVSHRSKNTNRRMSPVLRWANKLARLDVAKIMIFKEFSNVLYEKEAGTVLLDKWAQTGRIQEAVELVEFAASRNGRYKNPLTLACSCGPAEIVAHMLRAGADPNDGRKLDNLLSVALNYGSAEVVELLLEVGAQTTEIEQAIIWRLQEQVTNPSSNAFLRPLPDAPEKLHLLGQCGIKIRGLNEMDVSSSRHGFYGYPMVPYAGLPLVWDNSDDSDEYDYSDDE